MTFLLNLLGGRIVHKVVDKRIEGSPLDVKVGFRMLKDRRVPLRSKALAIAAGSFLIALLIAMELPIESIVSVMAFGLIPSVLVDGLEVVIGPVLFGCLFLPLFAPRELTQGFRLNHARATDGPVIDVESREAPQSTGARPL